MLRRVKDLSPDQRLAVESLLGRSVSDEEAVSIQAVSLATIVPSTLSEEQRKHELERIRAYFERIDAKRRAASDEEERVILDEALRSARPSYRPIS